MRAHNATALKPTSKAGRRGGESIARRRGVNYYLFVSERLAVRLLREWAISACCAVMSACDVAEGLLMRGSQKPPYGGCAVSVEHA